MNRIQLPLLAALALSACGRPTPAPADTATANESGNAAAVSSIMQPEVIAANPPAPAPTPTPTPTAVPLPQDVTIHFASGVVLDDAARAALDRLAADPALPADARLILRGSSDSPGSDRDNLLTSRRRAIAVRDYLVARGIAPARLTVVALGERRPAAPNANLDGTDDPVGRARNRRVDIAVVAGRAGDRPAPDATRSGTADPAA